VGLPRARPLPQGLSSLDEALLLLGSANDWVHARATSAHAHLVQGRILRLAGRVRRPWVALACASKLADQSGAEELGRRSEGPRHALERCRACDYRRRVLRRIEFLYQDTHSGQRRHDQLTIAR